MNAVSLEKYEYKLLLVTYDTYSEWPARLASESERLNFFEENDVEKPLFIYLFGLGVFVNISEKSIRKVVTEEKDIKGLRRQRSPRLKKAVDEALVWWREVQEQFCTEKAEFVVEKILKKRRRNGIVEYFLKWVGYDDSYNCWVPEFDVSLDLIQEFEQQHNKKIAGAIADNESDSRHVFQI